MFHVWPAPLTPKILAGFILGGCLLLTTNLVHAATSNSATLSWNANSESDLAGYNVYQGTTSGSYGPAVAVGNTTIYTAQNLQAGLTYYFAATAYDFSGNESFPSNEASTLISAPPTDLTPPINLTSPSSESTLIVNPASLTQEELERQKKLAKAEKKKQKKLAKIQKVLAKIEQKLVTRADNPKAVSRLNKKKVKLLAKQDKIQEKYSIN